MIILGLKDKTVRGVLWTICSQTTRLLLNIIVTAVLAHLLNPEDFGTIAMVAVFTVFFTIFNDIGLPSAIIQKQEVTDEQLSSLFWINLIEGILVTIILIALAPIIANFYDKSVLKPIVIVMSLLFTISSIGMIQLALFSKMMNFKTIAIIEIAASMAGGITAIILAAIGFGVWSFVFQALALNLVQSILLFSLSKWKPGFMFKWKPVKSFVQYGLPLMGFNLVNYFSRNMDNLLIGKYLGVKQLGYYDVAYKSLLFPLQNVSIVIGRVMFPALSKLEDEKERIRSAYTQATRYIALITFPVTAGLAVLAPQVVRVVLGPEWERAILIMQILAAIGGIQSLYTTVGWIYLSQGRTGILFVVGVIMAIIYVISFIIGLHWNIEGVAIAYAIAFLLILYPYYKIPFSFIDMQLWHYLKQFRSIFIATICMASFILGLRLLFERILELGDIPILVILIVVGVFTYIGLLSIIDSNILKDIKRTIQSILSRA